MDARNGDAKQTIHKTSATAALLAAVLSPVPLADEFVLVFVYGEMARRIGRSHGLSARTIPWKPIALTTVHGLVARAAVNLAVAFMPGIAAVANAASAVILTELLGRHIDVACETPEQARAVSLAGFVKPLFAREPGPASSL